MPEYRILIDKGEKTPLRFPASLKVCVGNPSHRQTTTVTLRTEMQTLKTADYLLGDEKGCVYSLGEGSPCAAIETKRSLREIAGQTLSDKRRATLGRALDRLAEFPGVPLVIFERPTKKSPLTEEEEVCATDTFCGMLLKRRLPWVIVSTGTASQRATTAELVARFLIHGVHHAY